MIDVDMHKGLRPGGPSRGEKDGDVHAAHVSLNISEQPRRRQPASFCEFFFELAQRSECCPDLFGEELGLLPRCKVATLIHLMKVDQVVITSFGPASRRAVNLAGEDSDRGRNARYRQH